MGETPAHANWFWQVPDRLHDRRAAALRAGRRVASEPHDNLAVAEGIRNAIVEVRAAQYERKMDKWISDSGTSC
jgi:hypothetical protein